MRDLDPGLSHTPGHPRQQSLKSTQYSHLPPPSPASQMCACLALGIISFHTVRTMARGRAETVEQRSHPRQTRAALLFPGKNVESVGLQLLTSVLNDEIMSFSPLISIAVMEAKNVSTCQFFSFFFCVTDVANRGQHAIYSGDR